MRIKLPQRKFTSAAVEEAISQVKAITGDMELFRMFECCFPNTLDTTVEIGEREGKPDTFIITGDIPAMWLRDSTAQVWPYLSLCKTDAPLRQLIQGVIHRQAYCVRLDPYANAFFRDPDETGEWAKDHTDMKPGIHERKWEVDSLCYFLRLSHGYWKTTNDLAPFDAAWQEAVGAVLRTFRQQQQAPLESVYRFERTTQRSTDTLPLNGWGNATRPCGLIRSAFRPSDDAAIFLYLIPANFFAASALRQTADLLRQVSPHLQLGNECLALAEEIFAALQREAIIPHRKYGSVYAYEVDGYGGVVLMDDANVPSLLSLPYLGCTPIDDPIYHNTRRLVLSEDNPYYFQGKAACGIGSPHTGFEHIWPISFVMRALTSDDDEEIRTCLQLLKTTHAGTYFMHESFHQNDPSQYTRSWFSWANTLFGELILNLSRTHPHLLQTR